MLHEIDRVKIQYDNQAIIEDDSLACLLSI